MSQQHKDTLSLLNPVKLGETFDQDIAIEGDHLDQLQASAEVLKKNMFVDTAHELIADWERVLGLTPGDDASMTARRAACVAKFKQRGGLSIPYFKQIARDLGYDIEITEFEPFMAGIGCAGDPVYVPGIVFCWEVRVLDQGDVIFEEDGDVIFEDDDALFDGGFPGQVTSAVPVYYFRAGESAAGDPLMSFGISDLEEVFNELKPAHTFVSFIYPEV